MMMMMMMMMMVMTMVMERGGGGALTLDISRVGRQPPGTSVKSTQAVLGQIS